ncbi:sn-glycerol-1-phosphate dehydrogenase [Paenibacillus donghaensis]|uniref:sn-glycerol-1-phosphate dehydrogenase n=1 Tax=Paenibacillus donghaensis TaxID=414771 RepID=A0A2Z2KJZ5_9BACL|nr:sn-glycerol-1-phosphate dehydrogenase [Paenibacillus donghaensis]ASA23630.1 sn-glycerol-1-phosphate dehydrogenase [Paenibacillus donghaensis]
MSDILHVIRAAAAEIAGGAAFALPEAILVEAGALKEVAPFIVEQGWKTPLLVADRITYEAAGARLAEACETAGVPLQITLVLANAQGDVIADEASVVQVLLAIQQHKADGVVVAGSGTLHDVARYAAYTAAIPFLSVPTAPSVDGFTSNGSPLIIRSNKLTIPAAGPVAIFADTDILRAAPGPMIAAGFGDMLGKYTSLFDWKYGRLTAGEPYSPEVAAITERALLACVEHAEEIGRHTEAGIQVLTEALIESGLAILLFGQSHSASGAEHHLSHYWEMEYIRTGRRQLLHGAKVGVACAEISTLYHELANTLGQESNSQWELIREEIRGLPTPERIRHLLKTVQGPSTIQELGVEKELLQRSLAEAHLIRMNRHTLLRARNEGTIAVVAE